MKRNIYYLAFIIVISGCKFEYKPKNNDVQDYHWLGLAGTEEICNDTIFTYNGKFGSDDFTARIIRSVNDTSFSYLYFDKEKNDWLEAIASFETIMKEEIPYLIVHFRNSVSMFTRRRSCPLKF